MNGNSESTPVASGNEASLNTADTILIRGAVALLTGQSGEASRSRGCDIRIRSGIISDIGALAPEPHEEIIDATDCVIYPAWVNTHHHLAQSLLKGIATGINSTLTPWLAAVPYYYRRVFNSNLLRIAARIGLAELALSGCGTVADHHYVYWPEIDFDGAEILFEEAERFGLRFVLCRGGATMDREFEASMPKACSAESLDSYLSDLTRLADRYNDTSPRSMRQIVAAPTTLMFSMRPEELRETATHARHLGLRLHSHLSETVLYQDICHARYECDPIDFAERVGWLGSDVWYAHLVKLRQHEIELLGSTGTGVAHCAQSNGRLGSGIAPVRLLENAGAIVCLTVDGTGSNEAADMLSEAHTAWLTARARAGFLARPSYQGGHGEDGATDATVEDIVRWGTANGARILGLSGVGCLQIGMSADIAIYALDEVRHYGFHDAAVAPVASGRATVRALLVNGHVVVKDGEIPALDVNELKHKANEAVTQLKRRVNG